MNKANEDRWYAFARRAWTLPASELIDEAQELIAAYEAEHGPVPMAKQLSPWETEWETDQTEREMIAEFKLMIYLLPKLESGELKREREAMKKVKGWH